MIYENIIHNFPIKPSIMSQGSQCNTGTVEVVSHAKPELWSTNDNLFPVAVTFFLSLRHHISKHVFYSNKVCIYQLQISFI